jgi:hypothetical protein
MGYNYAELKPEIFTESGVKRLLKVRDRVKQLLKSAGAFRMEEAGFVSWEDIACVEYLVELGELVELKRECWGQYRVFTDPKVDGR